MCLSQEGGMNEIIEIIEYFLKVIDSSAPFFAMYDRGGSREATKVRRGRRSNRDLGQRYI